MESSEPIQKRSFFYRILHFPLTRIVVGIVVCLGIPVLLNILVLKPVLEKIIQVESAEKIIRMILSFAVIIAVYVLLFRFYENRPVRELAGRYAAKENILGFIWGGLCIGLIILILRFSGSYSASTLNSFSPNSLEGSFDLPFAKLML
jgi:hypothetical protein